MARGAQRGINAAARRSDASVKASNASYRRTGKVDPVLQRKANKDADNLATLRANRRHRGA